MLTIQEMGLRAKAAADVLACCRAEKKNTALRAIAAALLDKKDTILQANSVDYKAAVASGMSAAMLDRLALTEERIEGIADAVLHVVGLDDPTGEILSMTTRPNGLRIGARRVPMGVIGIIYESRPNVTVDAAVLCLKAGSAVILRGGKEAFNTANTLTDIMRGALMSAGLPADCVQLVQDITRASSTAMMTAVGSIDLLIPRGGAGLIRAVTENATVPVIQTGVGNCHIYVEQTADLSMALDILYNAKTSRPSVCNAAESLLVDRAIAAAFLPAAKERLDGKNVRWFGCPETVAILGDGVEPATEEDYGREYLDYAISCKVVGGLDEAIDHISRYGTGHSEAIVTRDYFASEAFLDRVDAAAVYVNASTRFTDGGEFGMGAEIGISTQKLHARGPMGLKELTTVKYVVYGTGQIR